MNLEENSLQKVKWGSQFANYAEISKYFDSWAEEKGEGAYDKNCSQDNYLAPVKIYQVLSERINAGLTVIDFGCGTGLSGQFYIKDGLTVDGVDLSRRSLKLAKEKGYNSVFKKDLVQDELRLNKKYDVGICIGCLGEYVPVELVLPKIVKSMKGQSFLAITSEVENTNLEKVKGILNQYKFNIFYLDESLGCVSSSLNGENYYYIVARRNS